MIKDPTLAEVFKLIGEEDSDVADDVFDFYSNICYCQNDSQKDEITDANYKCMNLICELVKVEKMVPACCGNVPYIICKFTEFIESYKQAFIDYMNESYKEGYGYRPAEWDKIYDQDDEEFYDTFLSEFECLITGNRCDSDYNMLYDGIMKIRKERGEL